MLEIKYALKRGLFRQKSMSHTLWLRKITVKSWTGIFHFNKVPISFHDHDRDHPSFVQYKSLVPVQSDSLRSGSFRYHPDSFWSYLPSTTSYRVLNHLAASTRRVGEAQVPVRMYWKWLRIILGLESGIFREIPDPIDVENIKMVLTK